MSGGNDIFVLIIMVVALSGIGLFVLQPILQKGSDGESENYYMETPLHELLSRKNNLYRSIKDTEFDFRSAKLSEDDYEKLRDKLEREAMEVLEKIDNIEKGSKDDSLKSISKPAANKKKRNTTKKFCTECGEPYSKGTKFCTGCGGKLPD
ncbi:MAG TPA: zinc ribbon domain-containing protein [Actinobacteria bacterium]|nr:zinc ribbon domain-containing protein [Actinomycetes bacterium]HEX21220.1 zinc ribbon domain-containing protein [Actinomycetota bacterium]